MSTVSTVSDIGPETLEASFYKILQSRQPDQVMDAMTSAHYRGVVVSLPQSTFIEALHMLSPSYFVEPYRDLHRPIHPYAVEVKRLKPLEWIFEDFTDRLYRIISIRGGGLLGLAEYTHLLDCARSTGNADMADEIWRAMERNEIHPDIQCYNHLMEAHVWNHTYTGGEKYHLRMTPFAYRRRRFGDANLSWKGYGTAGRSVRKLVIEIWRDMLHRDIPGDEITYVNMFLASSRVGHVAGMKSLLKAVWNVDVDLLLATDDFSHHPPVAAYEPSSPLYPTDRLLFAIAHGFGTNNDMYAALLVMDFVSRSYNIPVPQKVWHELVERAFVLCRPRFGPRAEQDSRGKVPTSFVVGLFETMTSPPYNIPPTVNLYRMIAKTAWDEAQAGDFERHVCAAYELLCEARRKRTATRDAIGGFLEQVSLQLSDDNNENDNNETAKTLLNSQSLASAITTYDKYRLLTAQQCILLERLPSFFLQRHRWVKLKPNNSIDESTWDRREVPRLIHEWQDFLPRQIWYEISSGLVALENAAGSPFVRGDRVPIRRVGGYGYGGGGGRRDGPDGNDGITMQQQDMTIDERFWDGLRDRFGFLDFGKPPLDRLRYGFLGPRLRGRGRDMESGGESEPGYRRAFSGVKSRCQ